jgi:choice-of-anchor A domain-containing protein
LHFFYEEIIFMNMRLYSTGGVRALQLTSGLVIALALLGFLGFGQAAKAQTGFSLGDATNFAIMDEGAGKDDLDISGDTITGSIGIGDPTGKTVTELELTGATVTGNVDFAGAVDDSGTTSDTIKGTVTATDSTVTTDLTYLNNLSTTLGAESGTSLSISKSTTETINASSGKLDASGNYVFNVSAFALNGDTLTINGDNLGHNVVINFTNAGINPDFTGSTILLTGGLTASTVLFNVADGDTLTLNGMTINATFLDPNGAVSATGSTITGHVYGGGTTNSTYSGDTITDNGISPSK